MMNKNISKFLLASIITATTVGTATAQTKSSIFNKIIKKATGDTTTTKGSSLSNGDIVSGLKEALNVGASASASKLSAADGFFKDAAIKILLPPEVQKVEKTMRLVGAGPIFDKAILSLNRAAEDASKKAAPIFLSAIKNMSITDALGILQGGDSSATTYLRKSTTSNLSAAFKPVIDSSLIKVNATKYWSDVFTKYNQFSSKKVETDLSTYVTQKAMAGMYYYVGEEEKKIRKNPASYASSILTKVFGSK